MYEWQKNSEILTLCNIKLIFFLHSPHDVQPRGDGVDEIHVHRDIESPWGPLLIALMILIILGVCCCFMRIDPTTPQIYEIETERRIKEVTEAGFTDIELNNGRRDDDAFDNIAFEIGKLRSETGNIYYAQYYGD